MISQRLVLTTVKKPGRGLVRAARAAGFRLALLASGAAAVAFLHH